MTNASAPPRSWVPARLPSDWFALPTRRRLRRAVCAVERT